jgi:hypothetical protein
VVAIAAPEVHLSHVMFGGNETELDDDERRVRASLSKQLAAAFESRSVRSVTLDLSEPGASAVRKNYQPVFEAISHPAGGRAMIAEPSAYLVGQVRADALVFADFNGFIRTPGSQAVKYARDAAIVIATMGLLWVSEPNSRAIMRVTLVDAKSGEILWENQKEKEWDYATSYFSDDDLNAMTIQVMGTY